MLSGDVSMCSASPSEHKSCPVRVFVFGLRSLIYQEDIRSYVVLQTQPVY